MIGRTWSELFTSLIGERVTISTTKEMYSAVIVAAEAQFIEVKRLRWRDARDESTKSLVRKPDKIWTEFVAYAHVVDVALHNAKDWDGA